MIDDLTEDETKVYDKAIDEFAAGPSYKGYTERGAIGIRDNIQKDYAMLKLKQYRRYKNRYDMGD